MALIHIKSFAGEAPRVSPERLPSQMSQTAKGCHFYHGNLEALRVPGQQTSVLSNAKSLFQYLNQHWFAWDKVVDAVNSPVASDPWERVYFTGDGYPKVTNNAIFSGSQMPANAFRLGIQPPEIKINCVVHEGALEDDEVEDPNDNETRFYTHTFVTEQGEEGPPGEASERVEILRPDHPDTYVELTLSSPNANESNITHRRIYRTSTGGGAADYLFVAELPIAQGQFSDRVLDDELGLALNTYDYEMPPQDLTGLTRMANGILAGFTGNTICFSEAYLPYAWPSDYQMTTEHNIVSIVAMGNSLAVLTEGFPYIFSGVTPSGMAGQMLESKQACVSKRSSVIVNGTLIYATPDGLAALTNNGAVPLTDKIITREQWQKFQPATIEAYLQEGRYVAFYGVALDKCFIFDPANGDFRHFDETAYCGHNSLQDDALYIARNGNLYEWESSNQRYDYVWRSKVFETSDQSFACALVQGISLELSGIRIFADGLEILHLPIGQIPTVAFRLPSNRAKRWEVEVYGQGIIHSIAIADSMEEIKRSMND